MTVMRGVNGSFFPVLKSSGQRGESFGKQKKYKIVAKNELVTTKLQNNHLAFIPFLVMNLDDVLFLSLAQKTKPKDLCLSLIYFQ